MPTIEVVTLTDLAETWRVSAGFHRPPRITLGRDRYNARMSLAYERLAQFLEAELRMPHI